MDETEKPKKKLGRPFLELDVKQIENMASIQCTYKEIALVMGCSADTIADNYSDIVEAGRAKGIMSLKRAAWSRALKDSDALMKVLLGHYTEVKSRPDHSSEMYIVPIRDVGAQSTLENDILEVRNLLDAKPKVV